MQSSYQQQKPTYSLIHYCAWAESVKIPLAHGRRKSIGLWIHPNVENWIESTGSRWSSRRKISQTSPHMQILAPDSEHDDWNTVWTWAIPRTNHLHVNVQRHCMVRKETKIVHCEFKNRGRICKKIRTRTLVVSRAWTRTELVRNSHVQAERRMGSCRGGHDDHLQWKRTYHVPRIQCFRTGIFAKQRRKKVSLEEQKAQKEDQKLKTMVRRSIDQKLRLRNFRQKWEDRNRTLVTVLKEDQENAINGKPKDSVREETVAVSGTMRICVRNRQQNPLFPLNHRKNNICRSESRRTSLRGRSPSGKFAREPCRDYIKRQCTRPSCDFWILPNVNSVKLSRDTKSVISARPEVS